MKHAHGDEIFNILVGNNSARGFLFDKKRGAFPHRVLAQSAQPVTSEQA
jgi:hypothetical protein